MEAADSILRRMHRALPRPDVKPGEKFTTLSGGGWKEKETWTPERRKQIERMTWTWPILVLTGILLYQRYLGSEEQKQHMREIDRIMAHNAGLPVDFSKPAGAEETAKTPAAAAATSASATPAATKRP